MDSSHRDDINWSKWFHIVERRGIWAQLSDTAKAVYPVLLDHVDDATRNCWPSNSLIALEAGIHVKSVPNATKELGKWHLIKKWRKDRKNFYHLFTEQELEDLRPSSVDIRLRPDKMDKRLFSKPRDAKGRFIRPANTDTPNPSHMEQQKPPQMEMEVPPEMDTKNNSLKRSSEEESSKKKQPAGSAPASAEASASPALENPVSKRKPLTAMELAMAKRFYGNDLEEFARQLRRCGCSDEEIKKYWEETQKNAYRE